MPNSRGGRNFKKGRKKSGFTQEKQLLKKDPDEQQEYAQVIAPKGNGRFELLCCDGGKERLGVVCGQMRKRVWINRSDLVLIAKWEGMTNDDKCSIVHKYEEDEIHKLKSQGEFPDNIKLDEDNPFLDDSENLFSYENPSEEEGDKEEEKKEKKEKDSSSDEEDFFVDVNDI